MAPKILPDRAYVRDILDYNPETGLFRWRPRPLVYAFRHAGDVAGWNNRGTHNYIRIELDGAGYLAHRLAWLLVHGEPVPPIIDHIDGDTRNNRIDNLRASTKAENCANGVRRHHNTTGVKGVIRKPNGRFEAFVGYRSKRIHVGYFATLEEAAAARHEAAERLHGAFARHD